MNYAGTITDDFSADPNLPTYLTGYSKLESQESFELAILAYDRNLLPLKTYRDAVRAETALRNARIGFCSRAMLLFWYRDLPM